VVTLFFCLKVPESLSRPFSGDFVVKVILQKKRDQFS